MFVKKDQSVFFIDKSFLRMLHRLRKLFDLSDINISVHGFRHNFGATAVDFAVGTIVFIYLNVETPLSEEGYNKSRIFLKKFLEEEKKAINYRENFLQ